MKASKIHLIAIASLFLLVFLPQTAMGRVNLSIGIGTTFGHHHGHYFGHYPYYGWYGGYYRPWWRHSHWPGYYYPYGSSYWVHYSSPIVIGTPVRDKTEEEPPDNPRPGPPLSEQMRKEQGELLRVLRIGDKENRIAAIGELTAFYYDNKARVAIEQALLTDPEPEVRKEAATSLGRTSDPIATAALKTAKAKDPDRGVRQAAYRSIIMIEGY